MQTITAGSSHPRSFVPGTRTHAEARTAYSAEEMESGVAHSRFSEWDITSDLPNDSWEAEEQAAERRLRELRGCVKAARALVVTTPGLADVLQRDWQKAARFYARFEITEGQFRWGAPSDESQNSDADEIHQSWRMGPV